MANVTLKLSIGTFSIEVSGPAKYAEKKLEDLIAKYLSSSIKSGVSDSTSSTISSLQLSAGKKKRSPSEILKRAGNQADRALLLGYYLEKMDAQPSFTTTELKVKRHLVCKPWTIEKADENSNGIPWSVLHRPNNDKLRFHLPSLP